VTQQKQPYTIAYNGLRTPLPGEDDRTAVVTKLLRWLTCCPCHWVAVMSLHRSYTQRQRLPTQIWIRSSPWQKKLILDDEKTSQTSCPKLCINGVEVDLTISGYIEYCNTTTVQSWANEATPTILKPVDSIVIAIPVTVEGYILSIFGLPPITLALPLSFTVATSSIILAVAVAGTVPIRGTEFDYTQL
jgi:hypothetical protein